MLLRSDEAATETLEEQNVGFNNCNGDGKCI